MNKLKEIREEYGFSCNDMAVKLNISKTYYWQLENGLRNLYYKTAVKIAEIFKVNPDDIFLDKTLSTAAKSKINELIQISSNITFPACHNSLKNKFNNSLQNLKSENFQEIKININLLDFYIEELINLQIISKEKFINLIQKLSEINQLVN